MPQIKKQLLLNEEYVNWFYDTYGPDASLGWFVDLLLAKFIEVSEQKPVDYALLGAEALKKYFDEG
jgi:hypothetical protein